MAKTGFVPSDVMTVSGKTALPGKHGELFTYFKRWLKGKKPTIRRAKEFLKARKLDTVIVLP